MTSVSPITTAANVGAGTTVIAVVIVISVYNFMHSAKRLKKVLINGKYDADLNSDEFLSHSSSNSKEEPIT